MSNNNQVFDPFRSPFPRMKANKVIRVEPKHLDYLKPFDKEDKQRMLRFFVGKEQLLEIWEQLLLEENSILFEVVVSALDSYRTVNSGMRTLNDESRTADVRIRTIKVGDEK